MARCYIENVEAVTYGAVIRSLVVSHSFDVCQCLDPVAFEELGYKSTIVNCHCSEYASNPELSPDVVHRSFSRRPPTNLYVAQRVPVVSGCGPLIKRTAMKIKHRKNQWKVHTRMQPFHIETISLGW